jgi:hypothetical protein
MCSNVRCDEVKIYIPWINPTCKSKLGSRVTYQQTEEIDRSPDSAEEEGSDDSRRGEASVGRGSDRDSSALPGWRLPAGMESPMWGDATNCAGRWMVGLRGSSFASGWIHGKTTNEFLLSCSEFSMKRKPVELSVSFIIIFFLIKSVSLGRCEYAGWFHSLSFCGPNALWFSLIGFKIEYKFYKLHVSPYYHKTTYFRINSFIFSPKFDPKLQYTIFNVVCYVSILLKDSATS